MECPICLGNFVVPYVTPCGHSYCKDCLDSLITTNPSTTGRYQDREVSCPVCRQVFMASKATRNYNLEELSALAQRAEQENIQGGGIGNGSETRPPGHPKPTSHRPSKEEVVRGLLKLGATKTLAEYLHDVHQSVRTRMYILDDSGSTASFDGCQLDVTKEGKYYKKPCTRIDEIKHTALQHARYNLTLGVPSEYFLLNGQHNGGYVRLEPAALVGQELESYIDSQIAILQSMLEATVPMAGTPLAERLTDIQTRLSRMRLQQQSSHEQPHIFVVVLTDGVPTPSEWDGRLSTEGNLQVARRSMIARMRSIVSTFPVVLIVRLCTDEENVINFWNELDDEIEFPLDILDDIFGEAGEIAEKGNNFFVYWPFFHMVREAGVLDRVFDMLDERRLQPQQIMHLLSWITGVKPVHIESKDMKYDSYISSAEASGREQFRWNPLNGRIEPIISGKNLYTTFHPPGILRFIIFVALCIFVLWFQGYLDK